MAFLTYLAPTQSSICIAAKVSSRWNKTTCTGFRESWWSPALKANSSENVRICFAGFFSVWRWTLFLKCENDSGTSVHRHRKLGWNDEMNEKAQKWCEHFLQNIPLWDTDLQKNTFLDLSPRCSLPKLKAKFKPTFPMGKLTVGLRFLVCCCPAFKLLFWTWRRKFFLDQHKMTVKRFVLTSLHEITISL